MSVRNAEILASQRCGVVSRTAFTGKQPEVNLSERRTGGENMELLTNRSGIWLQIYAQEQKGLPDLQIAAAIDLFHSIGGDFYSVYNLPGKRVGVVIADVCGKDDWAAGMVEFIRTALYRKIANDLYSGQILKLLNDELSGLLPEDRFATMFLGIYDTVARRLEYASAGHPAGLMIHKDGSRSHLKSTGPGLGIMPDMSFGTDRIRVSGNDLLVLYTDGYGIDLEQGYLNEKAERVLNMIEKNRHHPVPDLVGFVQNDMLEQTDADTLEDDRTIMIMRFGAGLRPQPYASKTV